MVFAPCSAKFTMMQILPARAGSRSQDTDPLPDDLLIEIANSAALILTLQESTPVMGG
jgi:hypothetical protein